MTLTVVTMIPVEPLPAVQVKEIKSDKFLVGLNEWLKRYHLTAQYLYAHDWTGAIEISISNKNGYVGDFTIFEGDFICVKPIMCTCRNTIEVYSNSKTAKGIALLGEIPNPVPHLQAIMNQCLAAREYEWEIKKNVIHQLIQCGEIKSVENAIDQYGKYLIPVGTRDIQVTQDDLDLITNSLNPERKLH